MTRPILTAALLLAWLGAAPPAMAQSGGSAGALEVAVGGLYTKRAPLPAGSANETRPSGDTLPLFTTSTTLGAMTAAELQVGLHLSPRLELFGAGSFGRRQLRIDVANDQENAAAVTASERIQQFTFTGGVMWMLSESRLAPFVTAEGGQLRQLHEDKTLVESGLVYMAGGGINMLFADGGSFGLRITGRAVMRPKNLLLETKRVSPTVSASVFVRF